jgi:nucleotide-binding universal stress UspA family protein
MNEKTTARIVVGVDGSESSRDALRWALRQAALTGDQVEAVIAWEYPATYGWVMPPSDIDDTERAAESCLNEVLNDVAGSPVPAQVHTRVCQGNAARVLLDECKGADLLVVGSRGHGGFAGALLGSVGQHCVSHATCPVVVIRADDEATHA